MILQKREEKKNEIEKAVGRETRHINEQKNIRKTHQYDIRTGIKRKEEKKPNEKSKRESEGEWLEVKVNEQKNIRKTHHMTSEQEIEGKEVETEKLK